MLDNCGAHLVLRDREVAAQWPLHEGAALHCVALDDVPRPASPGRNGWPRAMPRPTPSPRPDWPFNVIYSSGTTGVPKGIVQSWAMRWAHVQRAVGNGYGPDAVSLCATPLYSNTTLAALPTLALGGTLVLMRKFDAAHYLRLAEQHGATHTMLVPVQYQRLLACPRSTPRSEPPANKFCTSAPFSAAQGRGAAPLAGPAHRVLRHDRGGVRCELHCHDFPNKLHTVGRPADGADIRFIDEQGRELPARRAGRDRRPLGRHDERLPPPARQDARGRMVRRPRASASSAAATWAGWTRTASSCWATA
jgi:hypothetical protein